MTSEPASTSDRLQSGTETPFAVKLLRWVLVVFLIYLLLLAIGFIGGGFKWASGGEKAAKELFAFASNPLVGLLVGTLATALVQSSSTVTSVIVGLVAGGLDPMIAVPMIMGANIGTTVTNTIVIMAHVTRPQEFRRAFAAATVHDCFNLLAVLIFLPLEVFTGVLSDSASWIGGLLLAGETQGVEVKSFNFIKPITKPIVNLVGKEGLLAGLGTWGGVLQIMIGMMMVFGVVFSLSKLLRRVMVGRAERLFHASVGRGPIRGIASGSIITVLVQSSSTTTSFIVPMAGAGILSLKQVFPFTLGANIGTTVTALLASLGAPAHADAALQVALVHLLFNIFGTALIYGVPPLRRLPLLAAERLADMGVRSKLAAIAWVLGIYFVLPLMVIGLMKLAGVDAPTLTSDAESPTSGTDAGTAEPVTPAAGQGADGER